VIATPDILHYASQQLDSGALAHATVAHRLWLFVMAALPGIVVLAIAARILRRAVLQSPLYRSGEGVGRAASMHNLTEVQLVHAVEEMAIAADIPTPRVRFIDGSHNGAAFGIDIGDATVLIGSGMAATLTRAQMQGVAAHLVASVAEGDMAIGLRTACTVGVFSLIHRLGLDVLASMEKAEAFRSAQRLLRALLYPSAANVGFILSELSDPLAAARPHVDGAAAGRQMSWQDWALMPFLGPVFFNGMIAGAINSVALSPLVNLAWRQRKYMADATSVRLTRDPDALDGALASIAAAGSCLEMPAWAGHHCLFAPGRVGNAGLLRKSWVAIFPPPAARHDALVKMGASKRAFPGVYAKQSLPVRIARAALFSLFGVIGVFVIGAMGCAYCFSLLGTFFAIAILHAILR
jgi:Zn-dependent protease with chaperone function